MSITDLPTELVAAIVDFLPAGNILNVRQSCKRLEHVTAKLFQKRYYEELYILITPRNLEFLRFVGSNKILRRSVRAVYVFPCLWGSWHNLKLESFDYYNGRKSREMVPPRLAQERFEAYRQILDEHRELIKFQTLRTCLTEVFGCFPNLDTVGLAHRDRGREENSRVEPLRCIDWLSIKLRTGQDPIHPTDGDFMGVREYYDRAKVLEAMLSAVASNNVSLKSLTSCKGACRSIGADQWNSTMLSSALRDVRQVHLCWTWYMNAKSGPQCNIMSQVLEPASRSVQRLHWGTASEGGKSSGPRKSTYHSLVDGINFQALTEVKLTTLLVATSTLPALLSSSRSTLRKLELTHVQLERTRSAIESCVR